MPLTIEQLKNLDARQQRNRPVLPKGEYVVEMGALVLRQMHSEKTGDYVQVSAALDVISTTVSDEDLEATAQEWGGSVSEMIDQAQLWFRKSLYDDQGNKDLHNLLIRATGRDDLPGDIGSLLKETKGLQVKAAVDVEVYDGVIRNSDVRKLLSVEG